MSKREMLESRAVKIRKVCIAIIILVFLFSITQIGISYAGGNSFTVTDVQIADKSEGVKIDSLSFEGNTIKANVELNKLDDSVTYKIRVKNEDSNSYIIDKITDNNENEYITYEYDTYHGTTFGAGQEIEIEITEKYSKEIDDISKREQSLNVEFLFSLENDEGEIIEKGMELDSNSNSNSNSSSSSNSNVKVNRWLFNPRTGDNIEIYFTLAVVSLIILIVLLKQNKAKVNGKAGQSKKSKGKHAKRFFSMLLVLVLLAPTISKAVNITDSILFENLVKIKSLLKVTYEVDGEEKEVIINYNEPLGDKLEDPEKEGYEFEGWSNEDGTDFDPDEPITDDITIIPIFTPITYNLSYELNGGTLEHENPTQYIIEDEFELYNPTKTGYTFTGWTGTDVPEKQLSVVIPKGSIGDREFEAFYEPSTNTPYTVIHKHETVDGSGYEVFETETLTGTTDTDVTPNPKDYTGFETPVSQTVTINPDGSTTVEYEYVRETYELTYPDTTYIDLTQSTPEGEYRYETPVTIVAEDRDGYTFTGWSDGVTDQTRTQDISEPISVVPQYSANTDTSYTVIHKQEKLDGSGYEVFETENLAGTTDTEVTPAPKTYTGFNTPAAQTITITGDGLASVEYEYSRITYTLTYPDTTYIDLTQSTPEGEYRYETPVTIVAEDREGYTFTGWSDGVTDQTRTENIANSITAVPEYTVNSYTITYYANDDETTGTMDVQTVFYNQTTNLIKNIFRKISYIFTGWNTNQEGTGTSYDDEEEILNLLPSGNLPLYAQWEEAFAVFLPGQEFNAKIKQIAGNENATYSTADTNIKKFERYSGTPDTSEFTDENIISTADSTAPIYAWLDNGTMYWWTEANNHSLNVDSSYMFYNLKAVTTIDTDSLNADNIETLAFFFKGCIALTELNINSWDTSKVTSLERTFDSCKSLTELDLDIDTRNVTNMEGTFENLKIQNLDLTNIDTSKVTTFRGTFFGNGVVNLNISNWNTSNVTNMYYAFGQMKNIEVLDLTSFDTSKVKLMEYMFCEDDKLTTIYASDNFVTTALTDYGRRMFDGSTKIVGGQGTRYNWQVVHDTYARIDGGESRPGYLTDKSKYVVIFDKNDNVATGTMTNQLIDVNTDTALNANSFVKQGYSFVKWNTLADGTGVDYQDGDIVNGSGILRLYAFWEANTNTPYTVIHQKQNLDDDEYTTFETETRYGTSGSTITVDTNYYPGFISPTAGQLTIAGDGSASITYQYNRTMKTLTYLSQYIDAENSTPAGSYKYGKPITIVAQDRPGYTFVQWASDATTQTFTFELTENVLIAPTYRQNKYSIEFKANAADATGTMPRIGDLMYTTAVTLIENVFERVHYVFTGWNTEADGNGTHYDDKEQVSRLSTIDGDTVNLYAEWLESVTTFENGARVNVIMKELATGVQEDTGPNNNILHVKRSTTAPDLDTLNCMDASENHSNFPIYMWFDDVDGTIYYWTEAEKLYGNDSMCGMFENLESVKDIDVSTIDTSNTKNMGNMFNRCLSLESIDLSNFDTANVEGFTGMFCSCQKLTSVDLSSFDVSNCYDFASMFAYCYELEELDLSNFITTNASNMSSMFSNCYALTDLDISGFDTKNVYDFSSMFHSCQTITEIDVSEFDTSNAYDMNSMFSDCYLLEDLDVSDFKTSGVTNMQNMFYGDGKLAELDVSGFDTKNVKNMQGMFSGCRYISELDVSEFITSKVTDMSMMFTGCTELTSLDLSNFDTTKVTNMENMFSSCTNLQTIDLSSFDTINVENMGAMFYWCTNATEIDVSSFDTSNVTTMRTMFLCCDNLEGLDLSRFNTSKVKDFEGMFYECGAITELDLTSFDTSSATNMTDMFAYCEALKTIFASEDFVTTNVTNSPNIFNLCFSLVGGQGTVYDGNHVGKEYAHIDGGTSNPGYFTYKSSQPIISTLQTGIKLNTILPNLDSNVTKFMKYSEVPDLSNITSQIISTEDSTVPIYAWCDNDTFYWWSEADIVYMNSDSSRMFYNCSKFTDINLNGLDTGNVTNMSNMFSRCSNLQNLDLGNEFDTSNVTRISGIFSDCSQLTSLDLGNKFDTSNATLMSSMFSGCKKLQSIDLGDKFDTSSATNISYMFNKCNLLDNLELGDKFDTSNVTDTSYMFGECSTLKTLNLENKFDTSKVKYMYSMFYKCSELTSLELGDKFDTSEAKSMDQMFCECSKLTTLNLGDKFNTSNATTMFSIFDGCKSITTLDLGENFDTSNVTSMFAMFRNCKNITTLNLGDKFDTSNSTNMNNMFAGCSKLQNLNLGDKFDTSNVTDMREMFYGLALENIDLGDKFDTSNVKDMYRMFYFNIYLLNLDLGEKFDTSKVTNMSYMFNYCKKLTTLDLGNKFDTSKVTDMGAAFQNCNELVSLNLGDKFDTSNVTNMSALFSACSKLPNIDLGDKFDTSKATSMFSMFSGCKKLENIDFGDKFYTSNVTNMYSMFNDCETLTELCLDEKFDTSKVTDMRNMFKNTKRLRRIYVSSSFVVDNVTSDDDMFHGALALTGANGTVYNYSNIKKDYAHIDGGVDNPGYFTDIADRGNVSGFMMMTGTRIIPDEEETLEEIPDDTVAELEAEGVKLHEVASTEVASNEEASNNIEPEVIEEQKEDTNIEEEIIESITEEIIEDEDDRIDEPTIDTVADDVAELEAEGVKLHEFATSDETDVSPEQDTFEDIEEADSNIIEEQIDIENNEIE